MEGKMSHQFFCDFADQTLRRLISKVVGLASIIILTYYLF
jgi:hypothetical protein